VLTRTVPTRDRAIQDRSGRGGLFLVHGLVVEAEAFARTGNNPFTFLDADCFVESPAGMVQRFGIRPGVAPPVTVTVGPISETDAETWETGELDRLHALASRAEEMRSLQKYVALRGSPPDVLAVLRSVFSRLGTDQRRACTFDTLSDAPHHQGDFWL